MVALSLLVVDASVAVKLIVDEDGKEEALARTRNETRLVAPDWLLVEAGNALWRKCASGVFDREVAEDLHAMLPRFFDEFRPSAPLAPTALALSFDLKHWIYDCIYLATAIDLGAPLLTADRKFWNAAKRSGYGDVVELLTWDGQGE